MSQPNLPLYPFSPNLNSFPVDDATTPGAFDDPTTPRQNWHDPAAQAALAQGVDPTTPLNYFYWDQNTGKQVFFTRSVLQASAPNIFLGPYPAYAPAPLVNVVASFPAFPLLKPINLTDPTNFATPDQASALAKILGGAVVDATISTELVTYPDNEPRRILGIRLANGSVVNVGKLLVLQNAQGVGAPGKWALDTNGNPNWVPTVAPAIVPPPIPTPQRALLSNEKITTVGFAGVSFFEIARTDLDSTTPPASAPSSLDQDTNTKVTQILAALQKLGLVS